MVGEGLWPVPQCMADDPGSGRGVSDPQGASEKGREARPTCASSIHLRLVWCGSLTRTSRLIFVLEEISVSTSFRNGTASRSGLRTEAIPNGALKINLGFQLGIKYTRGW